MGIVLQDEKVLDLLYNDVNIFNNTGLCTFKWLRWLEKKKLYRAIQKTCIFSLQRMHLKTCNHSTLDQLLFSGLNKPRLHISSSTLAASGHPPRLTQRLCCFSRVSCSPPTMMEERSHPKQPVQAEWS